MRRRDVSKEIRVEIANAQNGGFLTMTAPHRSPKVNITLVLDKVRAGFVEDR